MVSDLSFPDVEFRGNYKRLHSHESSLVETASTDAVMFNTDSVKVLSRHNSVMEEHEVMTPYNFSVKVYVKRSKMSTPILTFHDIGTNHNSFLGFFNYREMKVLLKYFTIYHICAPGHQENSGVIDMNTSTQEERDILLSSVENIENNRSYNSSRRSSGLGSGNSRRNSISGELPHNVHESPLNNLYVNSQNARYPSLDELAKIVESVVKYFKLNYFIGFGMGAGSNILCRYTLQNQDKVRALFLINPDAAVHGYYDWFKLRWFDIPQVKKGSPVTDNIMNFLESHWFGYGHNTNMEVSQYYEQITKDLNPVNVAGFLDSWLTRTDLGLVRTIGPDSVKNADPEHSISTDVCLVTGALATDLSKTLANMNGRMDPAKTQFLILEDCNGMLMEERPDKLALNFLYFLRTIGLLINLQPEILVREAEELQNKEFEALQDCATVPAITMCGDEVVSIF